MIGQNFNPDFVDNLSAIRQARVIWNPRVTAGAIGGSIRFSQRNHASGLFRSNSWSRRCGDPSDAPHNDRILPAARQTDMDHLSGGAYDEFSLNTQIPTDSFYFR